MPEGLPPSEIGKEIAEHRARAAREEHKEHGENEEKGAAAEGTGRDRVITVIEAILLAVVAALAA